MGNPPDRNPYDPPPSGEVETTAVEVSTQPVEIGCTGMMLIWAAIGLPAYIIVASAPLSPLDGNLYQRAFVTFLCGPLAWLALIYELLGMIGS